MGKVARGKTSVDALKEVGGETIGRDLFAESGIAMKVTPPSPAKVARPYSPQSWLEAQKSLVEGKVVPYATETLKNIPKSAVETLGGIKDLGKAVLQPLPTLKGIGQLATGGIEAGARALPGSQFTGPKRPEERAFEETVSKPVGKFLGEPTKIPGKAAEYVKEKPVEAALWALPLVGKVKSLTGLGEVAATSKAKNIEMAVNKGFGGIYKGLERRPQLTKDIKKAMTQAANTVVDTIGNKNSLKLVNEAGEEILGRTPKSIAEQAQAVEQGLERTGKEIEKVMENAQIAGSKERPTSIISELHNFANTEAAKLTGADKYALEEADKLVGKELDIKTIHEMKRHYNDLLKGDYTHDIVSKKEIDKKLLNYYRDAEDRVIDSFTGEDIKPIRNLYRDYKSIQKDVMAKYRAELSKQGIKGKGLVDLTDIYSVGEIGAGILSMHPLMIGKGLSFAVAKKALQRIWSVDRQIANMYSEVEKNLSSRPSLIKLGKTAAKAMGPAETIKRKIPTDKELEAKIKKWAEEENAKKKEKE
jgi:hypothetical protein